MKVHHRSDYATKRRAAYPPIEEQLDMLFHDPDAWYARIADVKALYPKPEEKTDGLV